MLSIWDQYLLELNRFLYLDPIEAGTVTESGSDWAERARLVFVIG